jgi:hypothetical protein
VAGSFEHGKETWISVKCLKFLDQLRDCWLLKMILLQKVNSGSRRELFLYIGETDKLSYIR